MDFTSQNPIWRRTVITEFLKALSVIPAATILTGPKVHLLGGTVQLNTDTPLATLTAAEVAYTGYAPVALPILTGPVNNIPGMEGMFADVTFVAPNPLTVTALLYGYWIDGLTPADWAMAEMFPQPYRLSVPGDFLDINLLLGLYFVNQVS